MQQEAVKRPRARSPFVVSFHRERRRVAPIRERIGQLQERTAFIEAFVAMCGVNAEVAGETAAIAGQVARLQVDLEAAVAGVKGVGPAEDCRRALHSIERRLQRVPLKPN